MALLPKIIVILGPTASGKTALGLNLAKKFYGEIVSADSRQVYKKMSIGTDKPKGEWKIDEVKKSIKSLKSKKVFLVEGIPHYLVDIVEPDEEFTLADFKKRAVACCRDILKRKKVPIIVGGTGLYIWSIVDNLDIPKVAPDVDLRNKLEKKSLSELVEDLKKIDPIAANNIDLKNPRRVIRALEVCLSTGKPFSEQRKVGKSLFDALQIGISHPKEVLFERINKRIDEQIQYGLVDEVKKLVTEGYSWDLHSMSSLGYKEMGEYLRGEATRSKAIEKFKNKTRHYAERQITWFKRDKRIVWLSENVFETSAKEVKNFLGGKDEIQNI